MASYRIDIGRVKEITGGDSFYKRELNFANEECVIVPYRIDIGRVKEITGGDSFYKRELNFANEECVIVPYRITFDQLTNLPTVVHKNGLLNDNRRENSKVVKPSLPNIKGTRIAYFDLDNDEQDFPNVP